MTDVATGTVLKPYVEYTDSGIDWLGVAPSHWSVTPLRRVAVNRTEQTTEKRDNDVYVALEHVESWTGRLRIDATATFSGQVKRFTDGDVLFGKLRPYLAKVHVAKTEGVCVGEFLTLRAIGAEPDYLGYFLRSAPTIDFISAQTAGARMPRAEWNVVGVTPVPIPPIEEQRAIARFLDRQDRRINRFIRAKRRLIELLNEQKQAIIQQAVTRGLDPNVPLKPSGIDWLGDIPAHWSTARLKDVARFNPSKSESASRVRSDDLVSFLPMESIGTDGSINASILRPIAEVYQGFTYFRKNDVVLAKITPCFENGKGAHLRSLPTDIGFGTTELIVMRPTSGLSGHFLRLLTNLRIFRSLGADAMTGAAGQQRVPLDFVKEFWVPIPPLREQKEIEARVEAITAQIQDTLARTQREIELIREYRTRLIADVVTGKLDVRNHPDAAETVPDDLEDDATPLEVLDDEPQDELSDEDFAVSADEEEEVSYASD